MSRPSAPFRVGAWCVDLSTGQLTRGADTRRARPLVAELLLHLAARAGEVVTKDELIAGPWGGAAVADSALTSTIAELRELLDDQPKAPQYIETLPKRGYRLIAPVDFAEPVADPVAAPAPMPAAPAVAPVPVAGTPSWRWSRRSWALAFGLGAVFAIAIAVSIASRPRAAPPRPVAAPRPMRLTVDLPGGVRLAPDATPRVAITADGARLAYIVRVESGPALYTRALEQFEARPVAGTEDASAPFFSPDGTRVGYFAEGELRTVPISGGAPTIVGTARVPLGASWAPDDQIVFSGTHGRGLFEVAAAGGPPRELTTPAHSARGELSHRWPQVLPDGNHVLFTAVGKGRADAVVVSRRTGERRVVLEHADGAMFVPPDRLLFDRGGRLHVTTMDPERFVTSGPVRVVVDDLSSGPGFGAPQFAVAGGGALVYVPLDPYDEQRELVWVDRSGRATSAGAPPKSYMHPQLSADGRQVLTWMRTRDPDVWLFEFATRALTRVITGEPARRAAWSPDGRRLMFDAPGPDNPVTLYVADVGGGQARRLRHATNSQYSGAWTADGRAFAIVDLRMASGFDITMMTSEDTDAPGTPLVNTPANETAPAFSPDGRWLAYVSDASGREDVLLQRYPAGGKPLLVSPNGGREPVWSARGDELFFRQGRTMWATRVTGGATPRVSDPVALFTGEYDMRPSFHPSYDVAPDGRFLMIRGVAPPTTDTRIAVLLRWDVP